MAAHTPSTLIERREMVRSTLADILDVSVMSRDRLTETAVAALAPQMAGPEVLHFMDSVVRFEGEFEQVLGGLLHLPSFVGGIQWTVMVDGYEAVVDQLPINDQLAPLHEWTRSNGKHVVRGDGRTLGRLRRLVIRVEPEDCDDVDVDDFRDEERLVLRGPQGWLDPSAGGPALVSVQGSRLSIVPASRVATPTRRQIAAVKNGFSRAVSHQLESIRAMFKDAPDVCSAEECILAAVALDRVAFLAGPVPPIDALFKAAGLPLRRGLAIRARAAA